MFRKLRAQPQDTRRSELLGLVRASRNVPAPMKAMAVLAVQRMRSDELDKALEIAHRIAPAVEAQDGPGVLAILRELNVPEDIVKVSEGLLGGRSNHHDPQP